MVEPEPADPRCAVCHTTIARYDENDPDSWVHTDDGDWDDHTAEKSDPQI